MKKKLLSLLIGAAVLTAALTGCTKDNTGSSSGTGAASLPSGTTTPSSSEEQTPEQTEGNTSVEQQPEQVVNTLWDYGQVAFGGGGFVTGVFSTCEEGVYYARTDVGGAYRWDNSEKKWKSLSYWVSDEDKGLLGIDGLAVDPNDASKLYLLAGTSYFSAGKTALLKSGDYGEHFEVIELTDMITVHGNGMGRGNGERIAIDPNNTDIIFAGGRTGGMIKSTDGGNTWETVDSFPINSTKNENGINIILFDPDSAKDGASQRIYAAVSRKQSDNIFVSEDGGATWNPMEGAIDTYMPQRIKLDNSGNLYVTYGSEEGPWNQHAGAVYRYNKDGTAEDISPSGTPFGDIVIDPNDNNRMVLVTTQTWVQQPNGAFGDTFYVTTDGGKTWKDIMPDMSMTTNGMSWIEDCAIHWCSSLSIDPFDSGKIMVTSGNGIFACDNIWDEKPEFYFNSYGIEELVPLDILSIEGLPLLVTAGDYDGFISEDISVPGKRFGDKIGTTESITVAAQNTNYWAKLGRSEEKQLLTYSTDGGKTWNHIENSPVSGTVYTGGTIAFNADGSRLLWSPEKAPVTYYTEDFGATWNECGGMAGGDYYLIGDPSNKDYVYALGMGVYRSADGGKNFEKVKGITAPAGDRICVDPHNEGTFYIPDTMSLYKVTDHGDTVETVSTVRGCDVMSLGKAKNDGDPLVMYILGFAEGYKNKGIYMSEDNGATWKLVNDDLHQFGGTANGGFIGGDMNVYGRCYMSTAGLGVAYCDLKDKG